MSGMDSFCVPSPFVEVFTGVGRGRGLFAKGTVRYGCFIYTVCWKYSLFIRFSPWRNQWLRQFAGCSFGTSRKKASTVFYGTAKKICRGMKMGSSMCLGKGKRFSVRWGSDSEAFFRYPGAAHRAERLCSGKAALESSKYGRGRRKAL